MYNDRDYLSVQYVDYGPAKGKLHDYDMLIAIDNKVIKDLEKLKALRSGFAGACVGVGVLVVVFLITTMTVT